MGKRIKDLSRAETDGYLAVDNATNGTGKMNTSVIFNNFAPAFNPEKTGGYKKNDPVMYKGEFYIFKVDHSGDWNNSDVYKLPVIRFFIDGTACQFASKDSNQLAKVFHSSEFVPGYLDSDGSFNTHAGQGATIGFTPVKAGDIVLWSFGSTTPSQMRCRFCVYDVNKNFIERISDSGFHYTGGGGNNYVVAQDGFIRVNAWTSGTIVNLEDLDSCVTIVRKSSTLYSDISLYERTSKIAGNFGGFVYTEAMLEKGYFNYEEGVGYTKAGHVGRVRNAVPLQVSKGDIVCTTDPAFILIVELSNQSGERIVSADARGLCMPADGLLYFYARKNDNSTIYPADVSGKVAIYRAAENKKEIFISDKTVVMKGYFDANNVIQSHAARIVNYRPIYANKGDIVLVNDNDLQMIIKECDAVTDVQVATSVHYISTRYKSPGDTHCGYYVVQNNNVVLRCQLAPLDGSVTSLNLPDYYNCIKLIRASKFDYEKEQLFKLTPKSSKRGRIIPSAAPVSQDGCFVGDELWMSYDGETTPPTQYINVINPVTGALIKTISHDFGHSGVSDYCEETDTLLTCVSPRVWLVPNASQITTSISSSDCIEIDLTDAGISGFSGCFGENKQTLYLMTGYRQSDTTVVNKIYKLWLGMTDGEYDGTYTLLGTYDGKVLGDFDADFGRNEVHYAQSLAYDGYLYCAYGTSGHNFIVIDLDNNTMTWRPVGRIAYEYFTADHTKKYLEPELVTIKGNKIVCGSRHYAEGISSLVEFQN